MNAKSEHVIGTYGDANSSRKARSQVAAVVLLLLCDCGCSQAQNVVATETMQEKVERLTAAMAQAQAQIDANQKALADMRQQLAALQTQMAAEKANSDATAAVAALSAAAHPSGVQPNGAQTSEAGRSGAPASPDEIRERLAIDESQIATHDQIKVETASKYPLAVTGLVLFNGFVNTRRVDVSAAPTYALPGSGSTGFSLRQTVLGFDARGPHLFGATSHADMRVDFFATGAQPSYAASGLLRLRTAHARLNWTNTEAFFELDRSILEPNAPSSLVAVAQPELAWAGNLWSWNPQIGLSHQFSLTESSRIKTQIALIDAAEPQTPGAANPETSTVTLAEYSRWPGIQGRVAYARGENGVGPEFGVGGYFSPHRTPDNFRYDAWAATMDLRLPVTRHFEVLANAYRGAGLAGLGGGGYVDYVYHYADWAEVPHGLSDVGGWTQLKARATERFEMNAGYGIDNPFSKEIAASVDPDGTTPYPGLLRNKSFFSNAIYSPSSYLLFSVEYRRFWTNYAYGPAYVSDVIGLGAGYRF
jgi:hypothetical protein